MTVCSVQEFMDFTSKILVERTNVAQRAAVREAGNYVCLYVQVFTVVCLVASADKLTVRTVGAN